MSEALILLSGGLDSTTCLAVAKEKGFDLVALSFDYGQRHRQELEAAKVIAEKFEVRGHHWVNLNLDSIGGSALTDSSIAIPVHDKSERIGDVTDQVIPITYVPARNTIFLSYALAWAEVLNLKDIYIGVNAVDYSGYPDCRPEYIKAFTALANLATRAGVEGNGLKIHTPLIELSKAEIITLGVSLGVDYAMTVSCYQADEQGRACGQCDSCHFRRQGFANANVADPTSYTETQT